MRSVSVRKSADISGIAAAVFGCSRAGRAIGTYSSGASKMWALIVPEYRSWDCTGSKPVSAIGKATRSEYGEDADVELSPAPLASATPLA